MVQPRFGVPYAYHGEHALCVDIYPADAMSPAPAIVWLHGGGLLFGARSDIPPEQASMYTDAGIKVVAADYRLAPEAKLPEIVDDVVELYAWVRNTAGELNIDPGRIAIVGHSAGAYLSLMCGAVLEPRPRAIVSFYGYGDILGDWYTKPSPHYSQQPAVSADEAWRAAENAPPGEDRMASLWPLYVYCRQQGLWTQTVTGCDLETDRSFVARYCPVRLVTDAYPPTLLLHGDEDTDVPHEQSVEMQAALEAAGVESRLITIVGGGHCFERYQADMQEVGSAMREAVDFLRVRLSL